VTFVISNPKQRVKPLPGDTGIAGRGVAEAEAEAEADLE